MNAPLAKIVLGPNWSPSRPIGSASPSTINWYESAIHTTVEVEAPNSAVSDGMAMATMEKSDVPSSVLAAAAASTAHFDPETARWGSAAIAYSADLGNISHGVCRGPRLS